MSNDILEKERQQLLEQLFKDTERPTRLNSEQRVAALSLAADIMLGPAKAGIRYSVTCGNATVTAHYSPEARLLAYQIQELIDELNNSVTEIPE